MPIETSVLVLLMVTLMRFAFERPFCDIHFILGDQPSFITVISSVKHSSSSIAKQSQFALTEPSCTGQEIVCENKYYSKESSYNIPSFAGPLIDGRLYSKKTNVVNAPKWRSRNASIDYILTLPNHFESINCVFISRRCTWKLVHHTIRLQCWCKTKITFKDKPREHATRLRIDCQLKIVSASTLMQIRMIISYY